MRKIIYCVVVLWMMSIIAGCSNEPKTAVSAIKIAEGEKDPAVWGRKFPNHYDSYLKNSEISKDHSKYKSDGQCRLSPWPFQFVLFDGWGFGIEYNEPNGHTEMMKDQLSIDGSRKKAGGVCLTCKTPYAPELRKKLDIDYFSRPYDAVLNEIPDKHKRLGLVCLDCHDPATMDLRISRHTLIEALKSIGKDPEKLTRQEKRSLVCAQCHVDYSIPKDKDGKSIGLVFPWKNGKWGNITIESVIRQIKDEGLKEWKHKPTAQELGHVRHPEFELYSSAGSVHWAAGVACADCHMPYERVGREKISSHRWESPMKKDMKACMQCHNQDARWLKEQVLNIQDRVNHMFTKAGYTLAAAALTIEAAGNIPLMDNASINKAKALYEEAYYRCTWIGAENSMGFHNPTEALRVLGDAIDIGRQAEMHAREAVIKMSATPLEFNMALIDEIVAQRYKSPDSKIGFKSGIRKRAALINEK
ncbi:ammonia-forming cytochrome c nitrite reductase subunit c552 [Candidatus Magnetobacterium casense]|uniref:Ammonia-forming cytochrome c nitrite reductase subunit c552 n=1 Tax=Candidatus Magnetobacterium casense TaxID=1455061 RepID=A0ABS6RVC7_9BACT|nr:ammonia-forming cytochrome c nitrite reductase subunit c552 [Candidatus Magnetobacterium casensis]MBV6340581.1 ammonia-forming cytochrome c nitrite reductase subunit c552 [Candidatus Magnetobacterium casensis]